MVVWSRGFPETRPPSLGGRLQSNHQLQHEQLELHPHDQLHEVLAPAVTVTLRGPVEVHPTWEFQVSIPFPSFQTHRSDPRTLHQTLSCFQQGVIFLRCTSGHVCF